MPDLDAVLSELREIMSPYAAKLVSTRDDAQELYFDTERVMKNKKPLFFGAVQVEKAYVSFHLTPLYVKPDLLKSVSPALRARMQSKSCFNFSAVDSGLFEELEELTRVGFASYHEQGFVP